MSTTWLVTGGAGFIGANFVLDAVAAGVRVVNLDLLTYAGNLDSLSAAKDSANHVFVQGDIGDRKLVERLLAEHQPDAIINFAAESHVDRSIHGPAAFIDTNVVGTSLLLEATRRHLETLDPQARQDFRFLHVSTDEVYGSLDPAKAQIDLRRRSGTGTLDTVAVRYPYEFRFLAPVVRLTNNGDDGSSPGTITLSSTFVMRNE